MSDLPKKLRERQPCLNPFQSIIDPGVVDEAADHIEALTAERDALREALTETRGKLQRSESRLRSYVKATGFDDAGACQICGGIEGCSHTFSERFTAARSPKDMGS